MTSCMTPLYGCNTASLNGCTTASSRALVTVWCSHLQARMIKGEEEYRSGLAKLKSARVEMQRLSASLAKGERSASGEGQGDEGRTQGQPQPRRMRVMASCRSVSQGHWHHLRGVNR